MKIRKSKNTGFCSGVKRAIKMVEKLSATKQGSIFTIGPLVHNPGVIAVLDKKGVRALKSIDGVDDLKGQIVLPTHGVSPKDSRYLSSRNLKYHDGTCPIVSNLQQIVSKLSKEGYSIIIYGEKEHPEVKAALGWAENGTAHAIATTDLTLAKQIRPGIRRLALLAQTTQTASSYAKFCQEIISEFLPGVLEIKILNTICAEVKKRQIAARELAQMSDLMIIVGGKGSSNTRRLAEVCQDAGARVFLIEDASEIQPDWFHNKSCVGIAAGTSTPAESVEAVEARIKELTSNFEKET